MRLIDADAYKKYCENMGNPFYDAVDSMPTIDAVQVVRCKDCKYYYKDENEDGYEMCDNSAGYDHVTEDGFCAWAMRKQGSEDERL